MVKRIWPWVLALFLVLGSLALIDRACNSNAAALKKAKAEYAALKQASEQYKAEQKQVLLRAEEMIAELNAGIAERAVAIAAKQGEINALLADVRDSQAATGGLRAANRKLREDAQAAIAANPTLQALIRNFDLTIGTQEKTISDLLGTIELKDSIIAEKDGQLANWKAKHEAQVIISETWKAGYEREYALRLQAEGLFKIAEHGRKAGKFWRIAALGGTIVGMVVGGAIR
jgi:uncharacterized coiled-coil protein SlyX